MTIRRRLVLAFGLVLGLFAVNIALYFWGSARRNDGFEALRRAVSRQILVVEISQDLDERRREADLMVPLVVDIGDPLTPEERASIQERIAALARKLGELERLSDEPERPRVSGLGQLYAQLADEWTAFYDRLDVLSRIQAGETPAGPVPAEPPSPPNELAVRVADAIAALQLDERQRVEETTQGFYEVARLTDRLSLTIFMVSALLAAVVALALTTHLAGGLGRLKHGAERLGKGELEHHIDMRGGDELSQLAAAFNEMSRSLKEAQSRAHEARDAAEQASRAKSTFLANMSHELRTPLNAIIGYTEMLLEDTPSEDATSVADLRRIQSAGKHLLGMINELLDLSKIEAGKMTLYLELFEVRAVIDDVVATIGPLAAKNRNRLAAHVSADAGTMKADQAKLRQTLLNLLSNACKFTSDGEVGLRTWREAEPDGDHLLFEVRDTGIGMTVEQTQKVFDEFTQADSSTTRKYGGTGLGLAISRRFCRLMGGEIEVRSVPGRGTTFTVSLPAEVRDPQLPNTLVEDATLAGVGVPARPAVAPEPAPPDGGDPSRPTVLAIDDDTATLDLLHRSLDADGFRVVTAADGERGLALAASLRPAAITLDVMMPGMDGWTILSRLKGAPETADIPVILLTMLDERQQGFTLGASEYLTKPIDRHRLSALLARFRGDGAGHVLVVEDDEASRTLLRRALEKDGWTVDEAASGRQALEILGTTRPSVILLDLVMPEMDGFELLRELRSAEALLRGFDAEGSGIPIVVVTGKELTQAERDDLSGRVVEVLAKGGPTSTESFLADVRALVRRCAV